MNYLLSFAAVLVLVHSMDGADEEVLPLFKIAGGGVVEFLLAIITEHQTGEHIACSFSVLFCGVVLPSRCL